MRRQVWVFRMAVLGVLAAVTVAVAQDGPPSGKVTVESKSVALGVGVSWGSHVVRVFQKTFQGKPHKFSVNGLSVVDLGVAKVSASGEVFNLKKLADFGGNYVAGEAGAAVGGGAGVVTMKNQNGVVMRLKATESGVKFTLAGKGAEVKLK